MAIVLQKDMRRGDTVLGRVFCNGRYYGDFSVDLPENVKIGSGKYSLHDSLYGEDYIDLVNRDGNTVATLSHKSSVAKLSILVGLDGLTFRAYKETYAVIKELYECGENVLVIREPLAMR